MDIGFQAPHIAGMIVTMSILTALFVVVMADVGLRKTDQPSSVRSRALIGLGGFLLALFFVIVYLAQAGFFAGEPGNVLQQPFALIIGITSTFYTLLLFWSPFRRVLDGISVAWLGMFNGLRVVFGYAFLALYELGGLPASFAFPVGYGDIVAGLLGMLTAFLFWQKSRVATFAAVVWIVVGLGDFVSALNVGTQLVPEVAPALQFWPLFLIPGYVVPIFIASQIYAIRTLLKIRQTYPKRSEAVLASLDSSL